MKQKYLFLLVLLLTSFLGQAQRSPWRTGEMEVKLNFTDPAQMKTIGELGLKGDIYTDHAWLYLTPDELEILKKTGIPYKINIPDLNAWSAGFGPALVPPGYYSFDKIKSIADSLATNFPDICKKVVYGFTPQMKELAALKISDNVNLDENEAEILFDGGIHGNEVGGSQNMIQFARDLCLAYGSDAYITGLVDSREIWIYYCVNPYGRDNMLRENGNGVDINRDYGYMWGAEGSSPGPFSQAESKALRDCQYSNQFVAYTNYHSGTETISYPWSYRYSPAPDNASINALAALYSTSSGYNSLPWGQGSLIMYLIQGSTKDFNYGTLGSVAWSIEISLDKQPLGPDIQYYYNINKPAMLALIEHCGYGIEGMVTDAVTGMPVQAAVWVGDNYPTYTDGAGGDYHKYLVPGTYTLRFSANGYESKTVSGVQVADMQTVVTDVQLQPVCSQYGYRTCVVKIPNFNAQNPGDEGYTAACLGAPDQKNYSLGKGGYVMVDMQTAVADGEGADITVYEGDGSPEGYSLYALADMDGYWNYLGSGTGTTNFDLAAAGIPEARFFVLLDDNNGSANINDAGFDFDAIENLHAAHPDTLAHLSGKVYDALSGSLLAGVQLTLGDSSMVTDTSGVFAFDALHGTGVLFASLTNYNSECDTLELAAGVQQNHDIYLGFNVGMPEQAKSMQVAAFPNPFSDRIEVRFFNPEAGTVKLMLTDIAGMQSLLLSESRMDAGPQRIVVSTAGDAGQPLRPGIYVLSLRSQGSAETIRMVCVGK
jgi:hypothetical protein